MRVLFLTHRVPYPPNRGDRIRAFHIVRLLSAVADLEVVSLAHDGDEYTRTSELMSRFPIRATAFRTSPVRNYARGLLALPGTRPLTHCLLNAPGLPAFLEQVVHDRPPDVVLAYCSGMARFALEPPLDRIPMVLDFIDVDSQKWAALARTATWPKRWIYQREAVHLGRFEAAAARVAATCTVVNERERRALLTLAPDADVRVVGLGVDIERLRPPSPASGRPDVVFCGVMNYEPNVQGVLWFVREVWPLVRADRPDARFLVVGANPVRDICALASEADGVVVTGTVPDVREYLWQSAVSVAPLLTSRGLQNKVLEALAAGLPAVVTPTVFEGLPPEVYSGCRVAESAQAVARETLALLAATPEERRAIAAVPALASMTWDAQIGPLVRLVTER